MKPHFTFIYELCIYTSYICICVNRTEYANILLRYRIFLAILLFDNKDTHNGFREIHSLLFHSLAITISQFYGLNLSLFVFWYYQKTRFTRADDGKRKIRPSANYLLLPNIWLNILSKFTSFFFSKYLCITLLTLKQTEKNNN